MKFNEELITPEIALRLLEMNTANRRKKYPRIDRYVNEMIAGRWIEGTAEAIKIAKSGRILDGQQRLTAIVKSGVSLKFTIARDLDEHVFKVLDSGSPRNATDSFHIEGIKNSNKIPSIITTYETLKKGISTKGGQINKKPSTSELLELYHKRDTFWQHVSTETHSWYLEFAKILPPSTLGGMYALLYDIDPIRSFGFLNQICTGTDIKNHTINTLRQKLIQDKTSTKKLSLTYRHALIIKTWNAYKRGVEIKILKWDSSREEFPKAE